MRKYFYLFFFAMVLIGIFGKEFMPKDASADLKIRHIKQYVDIMPVGTIIPWYDANGALSVPDCWKLANGTQISESRSPINGHYTPNMTSDTYLTGTSSALNWSGGTPSTVGGNDSSHNHSVSVVSHSGSTALSVSGTVSGSVSADGGHNHGGNTGWAGSHTHIYGYYDNNTTSFVPVGQTGEFVQRTSEWYDWGARSAQSFASDFYFNTDWAGAHEHSIGSVVNHSHGINIGVTSTGSASISHGHTASSAGATWTDNRPKSVRVKYIMKVCNVQ